MGRPGGAGDWDQWPTRQRGRLGPVVDRQRGRLGTSGRPGKAGGPCRGARRPVPWERREADLRCAGKGHPQRLYGGRSSPFARVDEMRSLCHWYKSRLFMQGTCGAYRPHTAWQAFAMTPGAIAICARDPKPEAGGLWGAHSWLYP
jgi:hypothetical protein